MSSPPIFDLDGTTHSLWRKHSYPVSEEEMWTAHTVTLHTKLSLKNAEGEAEGSAEQVTRGLLSVRSELPEVQPQACGFSSMVLTSLSLQQATHYLYGSDHTQGFVG